MRRREEDDAIPTCGTYRGTPLFAAQSATRIEAVKRDIDAAHLLSSPGDLLEFLGDVSKAPEARIYCQARLFAEHELAAEDRRRRPAIDLDVVRAYSYLRSRRWQHPNFHCSLLDGHPPIGFGPQPVRRERPLEKD